MAGGQIDVAVTTHAEYALILRGRVAAQLGDLQIAEISRFEHLDPWKAALSRELMPAGVRKHWTVLNQVMRDAVPHLRCDNPMRRPIGGHGNGLPRIATHQACVLDPDQVGILLAHCPRPIRSLVMALLGTGRVTRPAHRRCPPQPRSGAAGRADDAPRRHLCRAEDGPLAPHHCTGAKYGSPVRPPHRGKTARRLGIHDARRRAVESRNVAAAVLEAGCRRRSALSAAPAGCRAFRVGEPSSGLDLSLSGPAASAAAAAGSATYSRRLPDRRGLGFLCHPAAAGPRFDQDHVRHLRAPAALRRRCTTGRTRPATADHLTETGVRSRSFATTHLPTDRPSAAARCQAGAQAGLGQPSGGEGHGVGVLCAGAMPAVLLRWPPWRASYRSVRRHRSGRRAAR